MATRPAIPRPDRPPPEIPRSVPPSPAEKTAEELFWFLEHLARDRAIVPVNATSNWFAHYVSLWWRQALDIYKRAGGLITLCKFGNFPTDLKSRNAALDVLVKWASGQREFLMATLPSAVPPMKKPGKPGDPTRELVAARVRELKPSMKWQAVVAKINTEFPRPGNLWTVGALRGLNRN